MKNRLFRDHRARNLQEIEELRRICCEETDRAGQLCRGEDTMLSTAAGEVVPLTSDGDDWYLKVLITCGPHVTNARRVGFDA